MKIAGYNIRSMFGNNIIISTAKENGYPSCLMITVVRNGSVVSQTVCLDTPISNFVIQVKRHSESYPDYNWISRLNLATINKKHGYGKALFNRNHVNTLYCLV